MDKQVTKRNTITSEQRLQVIKEIKDSPSDSRSVVAARLGFPVATVKSIWKASDDIKKHADEAGPISAKRKRAQDGRFAELKNILFEWFQQQRTAKVPFTGPLLREKAIEIASRVRRLLRNFRCPYLNGLVRGGPPLVALQSRCQHTKRKPKCAI